MLRLALHRPSRFLLAGLWNTVFGFALFTALQLAFGESFGYVAVLTIAQVGAILQAHAIQRRWVWHSASSYLPELARFASVYVVGYLVNLAALAVAVEVFGLPIIPAQIVIGSVLIFINYAIARWFVFRPTMVESPAEKSASGNARPRKTVTP